MADNHTNFAVEQNSGVGLNAQNIGSGTGGNLEYKKIQVVSFELSCLIYNWLSAFL